LARLGQLPWISLVLAFSFGLYGLLRKIAAVGALIGLTVETLLLAPLAAGYLVCAEAHGRAAFQFLPAVTVYGEPFDARRAGAFACIWVAVALFAFDSVRRRAAEPVVDAWFR
jgi:RarD protein